MKEVSQHWMSASLISGIFMENLGFEGFFIGSSFVLQPIRNFW